MSANRRRAIRPGPGWCAARRWQRRRPPTPTLPANIRPVGPPPAITTACLVIAIDFPACHSVAPSASVNMVAIMWHGPGLAASPPARYKLEVGGECNPFSSLSRCRAASSLARTITVTTSNGSAQRCLSRAWGATTSGHWLLLGIRRVLAQDELLHYGVGKPAPGIDQCAREDQARAAIARRQVDVRERGRDQVAADT